jgi:4-hydroxybenzoate polyprenyltransferase
MPAPRAARRDDVYPPLPVAGPARVAPLVADTVRALSRAGAASTLHRLRRGEGALLAVNLSLVARQATTVADAIAPALVSLLTIAAMYAFNDLYDAPTDRNNPKKDRAVVAAYATHRRVGGIAILVASVLTVALALALVGDGAAIAVAGVMFVNLVYSTALKGVPVVDVVWCGLWGGLYAAVVGAPTPLLVVVGLMTAVCHLFQALDDRLADAEVGIETTAVRSPVLARNVLIALSLLLSLALWPVLGVAAVTAFTPLAIFFTVGKASSGWLLTKLYFGILWLSLVGAASVAAG